MDPYHLAAACYFAYGLIYLGGAIVALTPQRRVTFFGFFPWWGFYLAGSLMLLLLPLLVWRRKRWLTRLLAFGPAGKALTLCWRQGREGLVVHDLLFLVAAVLAAVLLFRAGWADRGRPILTAPGRR